MMNLLTSNGLFIGLIAMVVVVVLLCIGFAVLLIFKPIKTKSVVEADAVKKELNRRETELVIQIITEKAEGAKREELLNALRRIKWTQSLIDEIIRTEKTERGIVDKPAKKRPSGNAQRKPAVAKAEGNPAQRKPAEANKAETQEAKPAEAAEPEKKPAKKKESKNEFTPSEK